MKIQRILLIVSLLFNLVIACYLIDMLWKKGGMDYVKFKLGFVEAQLPYTKGFYYDTRTSIFDILPADTNAIVFAGNSITDYCEWNELLNNNHIKNRGISGDNIKGLIDRIDQVTAMQPKKIFLKIGINDLIQRYTCKQILHNYEILIKAVTQKSPHSKVYIQSILPVNEFDVVKNEDIIFINTNLKSMAAKYRLTYINVFDAVKTKDNKLDWAYTFDGLHFNGKGYLVWKGILQEYLNE